MTVETATYINQLDASYPAAGDAKSEGDNHLRLIKSTIKATLPNVSGAVTPTHTELNYVDGVTSAIQTQIDAKLATANLAASTGAALVGSIQSGTGAVARTVQTKLRETVSVKDFGATGDGVADDTAEIQAAIDAVGAAGGGVVYLPNGTYLVSAALTVTVAKTTIRGQSKGGTIITRASDYGSTFDFHGDSGTGALLADCGIESLTIKSTALTTSGAHIDFTGVTRSYIKDVYFLQGFIGMRLRGAVACTVDSVYLVFSNLYTGSATGRRYMDFGEAGGSYSHQSSGDIFVSNFNLRGTVATQYTEYGIRMTSADGIWFSNGHVGNTSVSNIHIGGSTAEPLNLVYFSNVMSDEGTTYSLLVSGSTSPDYRDIKFTNCCFKSGGVPANCSYGIVVAAACTVQHLMFDNCTVSEFGLGGVILQSTASRMIRFSGCHVFGNGRTTPGTEPGYNFSASVQDVEIVGGLSGRLYNGSGSGTQSYGIQFGGSHTNVRLIGVNLTGNTTASTATAATVYMADCITQNSLTVASASTLTLPDFGGQFHISGTTTVDTITASSTGRTVILIFDGVCTVTDAGNKTLASAFTSAAGDSLTLSYDGANWVEVSRSYTAGPGPGTFTTLLASGTGGLGYTTGSGGTVTQLTSKVTTVVLNKPSGQITTHNAALASVTNVAFQLTNSTVGINDTCIASINSASPNYSSYTVNTYTFAGGVVMVLRNASGGSLSDAVVIDYRIFKGAIA